jgi:hypothetical protein
VLDQFLKIVRLAKSKRRASRTLVEEKNIVDIWSTGSLYLTHMEDTNIAFNPNGRGFINWYQIDYATFDCFNWLVEEKE